MTILGDPTTSEQSVALEPFDTPQPTHCLADATPRTRVVVRGTVWSVDPVVWAGGPVLEVTLVDPTGRLVLAFLGRHEVGGIQPGRQLVVAGIVGRNRGRPILLNPQLWLVPTPAPSLSSNGHQPAVRGHEPV